MDEITLKLRSHVFLEAVELLDISTDNNLTSTDSFNKKQRPKTITRDESKTFMSPPYGPILED
jgi:hypothetical protein